MSTAPLYPAARPAIKEALLAKSSNRVWRPELLADAPPLPCTGGIFVPCSWGRCIQCMILLLAWAVMREAVRPAGTNDRFANPHGCPFCV